MNITVPNPNTCPHCGKCPHCGQKANPYQKDLDPYPVYPGTAPTVPWINPVAKPYITSCGTSTYTGPELTVWNKDA